MPPHNGVRQELKIQIALRVKSGLFPYNGNVDLELFLKVCFLNSCFIYIKKMGRISIGYSIKQLLSLQGGLVLDYINIDYVGTSLPRPELHRSAICQLTWISSTPLE